MRFQNYLNWIYSTCAVLRHEYADWRLAGDGRPLQRDPGDVPPLTSRVRILSPRVRREHGGGLKHKTLIFQDRKFQKVRVYRILSTLYMSESYRCWDHGRHACLVPSLRVADSALFSKVRNEVMEIVTVVGGLRGLLQVDL